MAKTKLNGSTELLAKAMRQVFTEAVQEGIEPVKSAVDGLKQDVDGMRNTMATKADLETTNKNVQAQLAQNRQDIAGDVKKALKDG